MHVHPAIRIAVVVAVASVACSSDQKAGILLDIDAAANVDRAVITSLAVTVDARTQVYSPTSLPGSLGIRTSAGSHHIIVYGPAASPIVRWEGTVVAVSSGDVPSTRVLLEAIVTGYSADAGSDVLVGAGGSADGAGKDDGARDSVGAGGAGGTMGTGGIPATGGSLGMDGGGDLGGDVALPDSDGDVPDAPGTGGFAMTGGRTGSGGAIGTGGILGTGGVFARGGAGGKGSGGSGSGGRTTGSGGVGTGGAAAGGRSGTGGGGSGGSSVRTDAGAQGGSGGSTDVVGRARVGVFNSGVWRIDSNDDGMWEPNSDSQVTYGNPGDTPVTGDWTGTGRVRLGLFRDGTWTFDENGNGILDSGDPTVTFGRQGDKPVTGAWTGTGRTLIGFYRDGDWYLDWDGDRVWNASVDKHHSFGGTDYRPVVGDWTGTGTARIGVFKTDDPDFAYWTFDIDGNGTRTSSPDFAMSFGVYSDIPVPGPWGSTKQAQVGIFRDGLWNLDVDGDYNWNLGIDWSFTFGGAGDTPVVFVRP